MHQIRIDTEKNRLYLTLESISDREETRDIVVRTQLLIKSLRQGFTCITDLTRYCCEGEASENFMREIQEILWDAGVKRVARISPNCLAKGHFRFEEKSAVWPGYEVVPATTLQEAEMLLDG